MDHGTGIDALHPRSDGRHNNKAGVPALWVKEPPPLLPWKRTEFANHS